MKFVEAVIQPHHLTAVLAALERVNVERLTVLDGHSHRQPERHRDEHFGGWPGASMLRQVILEIVVNDDFLERTLEAIRNAARSGPLGREGDGKIFVLPVAETVQIGGTDRGPGAV
ncbi:MAG TPA: P-II family nitrogen regulator [Pirellulaceae bacterium]